MRKGEPLSAAMQRNNIKRAAEALALLLHDGHQLVITHGNGPQVGLLALQNEKTEGARAFPLDVLGAETEGMIGYVLQQELDNAYAPNARFATLLTQVEVDPHDPAFSAPSKPVGAFYTKDEIEHLSAQRGWSVAVDGDAYRRVVPSPKPLRILEIDVIRLLIEQHVIVICAGGGGIPVVRRRDDSLIGIEAVVDKDLASGLLAKALGADAFLMLTDVENVFRDWDTAQRSAIKETTPQALRAMEFAAGSMAPKVAAACDFVEHTGAIAGIGALDAARNILCGKAGTLIRSVRSSY